MLSNLGVVRKVTLAGVGVRWKKFGPIRAKVYSAGIYVDRPAAVSTKKKLNVKTVENFDQTKEFEEILIHSDLNKSILLKMAREIGADTLISALSESIKPRIGKDTDALKSFEKILSEGLQNGKVKNSSTFRFDSNPQGALTVHVDGSKRGTINSKSLVKALFGTYLDKNTVSPTLKENVGQTISKW